MDKHVANTVTLRKTDVLPSWAGKVGKALRLLASFSEKSAIKILAQLWFKPFIPKSKPHVRQWYDSADQTIPLSVNNAYVFGDAGKPVVLCVHGWRGRSYQLRRFAQPLLESGFRVAFVNLPAHGDVGKNRTDIYECANLIKEVWDKLGGIDSIVSHSFGAPSVVLSLGKERVPRKLAFIAGNFDVDYLLDKYVEVFQLEHLKPKVEAEIIKICDKRIFKGAWQQLEMTTMTNKLGSIESCFFQDPKDPEINTQINADICSQLENGSIQEMQDVGHFDILRSEETVKMVHDYIAN